MPQNIKTELKSGKGASVLSPALSDVDLIRLIKKAGDFIGTDESLRSWVCIEVALDHAFNKIREELEDMRNYWQEANELRER